MTPKRLYRGKGTKTRQLRAFRQRYGARGAVVYGKVIGKVHREQVALREPGAATEHVRSFWVPGHMSHRGRKKFRVTGHIVHGHTARIRA